eukprot:NODE_24_length_41419_cov_0.818780.p10 type:complete len:366 gc:universal NODE_24_length_41419_cov_0.818780:31829-30732(-)
MFCCIFLTFALQTVGDLNDCKSKKFDVAMIGSMGDSVLAGYGSRQFTAWPFFNPANFREDRGATAVSGGDSDMWSVVNMAKKFNPDIKGASTGTHWINLCRGILCFWPFNRFRESDGLNMAETGAFASDSMRQAKELVKRIRKMYIKEPELQKKWKLIVFFVGLNDQFNNCRRFQSTLPYFDFYVREIMNYLRSELEFVIVDVLSIWDLEKMVELSSTHPNCQHNNRQKLFRSMCPCPFDKNGQEFRSKMKAYQIGQNRILKGIVDEYKNGTAWSKKEKASWIGKPSNFKLIYDPSAENMDLTSLHYSSLTKTDCSHPTKEMHERLATVYWRNLFLRSSEKKKDQNWAFNKGFIEFTCPDTIQFE